jgi:hypothetical protein
LGIYWHAELVDRKIRKKIFGNDFPFEGFYGGKQCGNK